MVDQPEAVTGPDVISISGTFEGEPLPADAFRLNDTEYDAYFGGDMDKPVHCRVTEVSLKRPDGVRETDGKTVHLSVTHFLQSTGTAYTSEMDVAFAPYQAE